MMFAWIIIFIVKTNNKTNQTDQTMKTTSKLLTILLLASAISASAQNYGQQAALTMEAVCTKTPACIVLAWPVRTDIKNYALQRKATGTTTVTLSLAATTNGHTDHTVTPGVVYEYKLIGYPLVTGTPTSFGSVRAGIEVPLVESRGKVLIVMDSGIVTQNVSKINRLSDDLTGEGWVVEQLVVNATDSVASVKSQIVSRHTASAGTLKSLILLGHVPVPYSGNLNPDSHTEHKGAWPCDGYYGDMDSNVWTDTTVNNSTAARPENRNIPGDGKFDQSSFPGTVELTVGRIDFANLPAFAPLTHADLIGRYLDKNHNFRTGATSVARSGLVDDNLASMTEALSAAGRRAICASFGSANLIDGDFLTHGSAKLMGVGIGYGSYSSVQGVGATANFVTGTVNTVFNQNFGSYFGDWDSQDNVMRALIAANGVSLTTMWGGRPVINLYGMALGRTVGECVQSSMNQGTDAYLQIGYNSKGTHIGLMGDPTLRLFPVLPATNVKAEITNGTAAVTWTASAATGVVGYNVYRADAAGQAFVLRNASLVTGNSFSDAGAPATSRYMVKAVKLEASKSGTFFNDSCGAIINATTVVVNDAVANWKQQYFGANFASNALAADNADADKDGVCNLVEYAMGTNPVSATSKNGLQNVCLTNTASGRKLCATYSTCNASTGVSFVVECSSDLTNWSAVPTATTLSNFGGYTMKQVSVSAAGQKCFFRVRVSRI